GDLGLTKTGQVEPGRIAYTAGPVRIDSQTVQLGAAAQPGGTVLTWTGTSRVVTVDLDVQDKRIAKAGAAVQVKLPDDSTVAGTISRVETVVQSSDDPNGSPTTKVEVTVAVPNARQLDDYDAASVTVSFTAGRRQGVLAVPVDALLALAEGGY